MISHVIASATVVQLMTSPKVLGRGDPAEAVQFPKTMLIPRGINPADLPLSVREALQCQVNAGAGG